MRADGLWGGQIPQADPPTTKSSPRVCPAPHMCLVCSSTRLACPSMHLTCSSTHLTCSSTYLACAGALIVPSTAAPPPKRAKLPVHPPPKQTFLPTRAPSACPSPRLARPKVSQRARRAFRGGNKAAKNAAPGAGTDLAVDDGGEAEVVEDLGAVAPNGDGTVFP